MSEKSHTEQSKPVAVAVFTAIILLLACHAPAQTTSPLVRPAGNGKLEYTAYANRGQTNAVNRIPDFSYAGYRMGGVSLPEVPVALTLNPVQGDNRQQIQQAIDLVSALAPGEGGFRGAILLKPGLYSCSGPITIKTSGVVLRGEGQMPASEGGTQLHTTLASQHNFITFSGRQPVQTSTAFVADTLVVPGIRTGDFNNDGKTDTIDGKIWLNADVTQAAQPEYEGDGVLSLRLAAGNGEYVSFDSREGNSKPYLKVTLTPETTGRDTTMTIIPSDDVFVQGGEYADQNFGTDKNLVIKNSGQGNRVTREIYLKFRLPALTGTLKSALLWLWCNNAGNTGAQPVYVLAVSNDDWTEKTVTYHNQPYLESRNIRITTPYVPVGSNELELESGSSFRAGDLVVVLRTPNQTWIDDLAMAQYGWTAGAYQVGYERRITRVQGNLISFDVPTVQAIESKYGGGEIYKIDNSGRTGNCGIENMFITSSYTFDEDENHGWTAVIFSDTEDCWAKNVTARYFGYGCIGIFGSNAVTIQDCAMLDAKSITTGSRKYSFYIDKGSFNLFQRCYTRGGRHDFVTGSKVAGPNVFLDCASDETYADTGPHHRYATGILFDNISGGQTRVQNRKDMGSGHGWAGAQTMFWNLEAKGYDIKVESPPGAMNWGIGCIAPIQYGDGYWDNWGTHVLPRSLYLKQLEDRLGSEAVRNVTTLHQREDNLYEILRQWRGIGKILPDDARLLGISVNDSPVPGFDPMKKEYSVVLPAQQGSAAPVLSFTLSDPLAKAGIKNVTSLPGTAEISVTAQNGITRRVYSVVLTTATSAKITGKSSLKIYPNPAGRWLRVEIPQGETGKSYTITSSDGKRVKAGSVRITTEMIDISDLQNGIYLFVYGDKGKGILFLKK